MKFTFNWLKEFVDVKSSPAELADLLTMAGLEVESLALVREPDAGAEDWSFEISVTPNRGDCLGIAGLAREVAALAGGALKQPPVSLRSKEAAEDRARVTIEDAKLCPRYSARLADQLRVAASPGWLRFRLEACGIRSINNAVDVTNYVMLETGQPLHAFDLDRLPARHIVVRAAGAIQRFTTLDGVERELRPEDLLICDGDLPVALAGIMGGMNSEVGGSTRTVLLESANFNPITVRRTAKRLGLHSEASHRFERAVDPEGTLAALDRAVYLLRQVAGAAPDDRAIDVYPSPPERATITLREQRIEQILGTRIETGRAETLLRSLGLETSTSPAGKAIEVVRSTRRPDLARESDLIEELARLHGYDKIPSTLPLCRIAGGKKDVRLGWERRLRSFLAGAGLMEVINLPFTGEQLNQTFSGLWESGAPVPVAVLNPLTKESAEMRLSLIPGLLDNLRLNLAQRAGSFHAYHLGKTFQQGASGEPEERHCLAGILYGPRARHGLGQAQEAPGFLECKGLIEGMLDLFHISAVHWRAESFRSLHPGKTAALVRGENRLGYLGQIHPDLSEALELPPCFVFELDFDKLLEYAPRQVTARNLPRFPNIERDLAVVVDGAFPSQQIVSWISDLGEALIEHVEVFDQYLGPPIPEGKKSLAYKISYRADDRTLTDAEVQSLHQRIVERIGEVFGAQLRT
jgi:phenylalanyl-tRNA synthetase beta chain